MLKAKAGGIRHSVAQLWLGAIALTTAAVAPAQECPGDIDGDRRVHIEELTAIVHLAGAGCPTHISVPCPADVDMDEHIAGSEVGIAIDHALSDCSPVWRRDVYLPSSFFANRCALPRSGTDPITGQPYPDMAGSVLEENHWLRSWTNETYLWYREVEDVNPAGYDTPTYFDLLRTGATLPSGELKDQFHFQLPTDEYHSTVEAGEEVGYGAQWIVLPGPQFVVAFTEPNAPATSPAVNLTRGTVVRSVDGVNVSTATTPAAMDTVLRGLYPRMEGEQHTFVVMDVSGFTRTVRMAATRVVTSPVQNVAIVSRVNGVVGYILFNAHIATAEGALVQAITQLRAAHITDLVLDLRYNTGGYLDIASQLAFMIAGPSRTAGHPFESYVFNDHLAPSQVPFHATTIGFSAPCCNSLPTLSLPRVFVLTGSSTCSASEAIINSLRGVDVEVIQVGWTTCGKPYGFFPEDNCGTTYFAIQFQGVNAKGFGDYPAGFSPQNTTPAVGELLPGCFVGDDLNHALGDANEARLAAALSYRNSGMCPAVPRAYRGEPVQDGDLRRPPWLQNRLARWRLWSPR